MGDSRTDKRMAWFREARYGIFIHWGLYAQLGGYWNGEKVTAFDGAEWIMRDGKIPVEEYRKLAKEFNPVEFDADAMVARVAAYGGKYLCFTAKHHDGFAMYHSQVSDYNIMHTPFGRDVVKELSEACAKYGIIFCLYYSQMQDWEDPDADGNTWDFDPEKKNFSAYFYRKVKPQVQELLTNYGKIGMIWFDTPYDMPRDLSDELAEFVHELQPDCLISGRIGYGLGDFREMNDNAIPHNLFPEDWESPMTLNNTWGYSKTDHHWKSARTVVDMMVNIAGKGGNLLLNIGPDELGRIPQESDDILMEVGQFLEKNGESIYGTIGMPDFPYDNVWGGCTRKKDRFYLHVLTYPDEPYEIRIYNLKSKVRRVYLLETGEELSFVQKYEIARDEYRFRTFFPEKPVNVLDTVAVVELDTPLEYHDLRTIYAQK
ncbi:MAG: alpha-L-fucosidase [Lachnospiraceae bacterium]|jgi:alpha-L-fucosidase|nr:alpha-L-fucosidase [Lachnospiraceae bacterium]MCI8996008.1 alpha-L-fucosidase [Lachnospiraceae bacterium]